MTARICFVDCETTGLDPDRHGPWEIAIVSREVDGSEREHLWQVRPDLTVADAKALEVGRFWSRFQLDSLPMATLVGAAAWVPADAPGDDDDPEAGVWGSWDSRAPWRVAMDVSRVLSGAHLAGANPAFDAAMLTRSLRANGAPAPTWHHRLIDVEAYAAGALGEPVPMSLSDTAAALGVEVDREQQHGALYDAQLAKQVYDAATRIDLTDQKPELGRATTGALINELDSRLSIVAALDDEPTDPGARDALDQIATVLAERGLMTLTGGGGRG